MTCKVGDRVRAYDGLEKYIGIIKSIDNEDGIALISVNHKGDYYVQLKQCRKLKKKIKRTVIDWISVFDRLPEKGTKVLFLTTMVKDIFSGNISCVGASPALYDGDSVAFENEYLTYLASHWAYMPELPKRK